MTTLPKSDGRIVTQDAVAMPQWKLDLIEDARNLIVAREANIKRRNELTALLASDLVKNVSIGK